jgi:hypothetical protein
MIFTPESQCLERIVVKFFALIGMTPHWESIFVAGSALLFLYGCNTESALLIIRWECTMPAMSS